MLGTGIITPLVTPLVDFETLDRDSLRALIEHVIQGGVSGVFLLGTTGEGPSLSYALRAELIREAAKIVAGRVPILVCITDTAFAESVRVAQLAADAGAAAVVAAAPYYLYCTQSDLRHYLGRLTDAVTLPLFLYNMPQLTKMAFEIDTVHAAVQNQKIIGLKDSSGDLDYVQQVIGAAGVREGFHVMIGPEEKLADGMRLGCTGGVSGGSNLNPQLFVGIYQAALSRDWAEADRLQAESRAMSNAIYTVGDRSVSYLRGLKAALSIAGLCRDTMALPLTSLSPSEKEVLRTRIDELARVHV